MGQIKWNVLNYRIYLYFDKHKLALKVDKFGHSDRNIYYKIQRQKEIEKELGCVFIRIDPDEENFNKRKIVNDIFRHVKKVNKKVFDRQDFEKAIRITV